VKGKSEATCAVRRSRYRGFVHGLAQLIGRDAQLGEHTNGDGGGSASNTEEQVLRADVAVTHLERLLAGARHAGAGSARVPREELIVGDRSCGVTVHESLLRALFRHAERGADLGPGSTRMTRRVDEVPSSRSALLVISPDTSAAAATRVSASWSALAVVHGLDELGQRRCGCQPSTLS